MTTLLAVDQLQISFPQDRAASLVPVDDVTFEIAAGEWVALVGESGCGKTLTGLAIPRLLPPQAQIGRQSSIRFNGENLLALKDRDLRPLRGRRIAMIFQDPATSLNPVMRVGDQVMEAIRAHPDLLYPDLRQRTIELFHEVGIADPERRVDEYPHQLSGGMRQRVMIAIALSTNPDLLIADEPTTALDVTVQAQILELLDRIRASRQMAILLITHDLGIVAGRADRVLVMYAGRVIEMASTRELFAKPMHPYTRGLFASIPTLDHLDERLDPYPAVFRLLTSGQLAAAFTPAVHWPFRCAALIARP